MRTYSGTSLAGIAVIVLAMPGIPGHAYAQASVDDDGAVIEEIIVRAQKRSQDLQIVPIAVTAFTEAMIRELGMLNMTRLTELHPSVSFDNAQSFQNSSLKIRGIGTVGNGRGFEGAVGVFVDGVYRPRSAMALADLMDIGQIEVLRGPQSTLFGKNTVAGTISMNSVAPDMQETGGSAEIRVGNLDQFYLSGAFNTPLGEHSALRLAAYTHERDGFFESTDNGAQYDTLSQYGFKAQWLWEPTDDLRIQLIGDVAKSDAHCCWGAAIANNGATVPLIGAYAAVNGLSFVAAPEAEDSRALSLNTLPGEEIEDSGVTALISWNFGSMTLESITGIRSWTHDQISADTDFSPANLLILDEPTEIEQVSQEFNLLMPLGNAELLLGLYYQDEQFDSERSIASGSDADNFFNALASGAQGAVACLPPVVELDCLFPTGIGALLPDGEFTRERYTSESESLALFAHLTAPVSETFTIVAGLRLSSEEKKGGVENLFWYDSAIVRAVLAAAGIPDDGTPRNGLDLIGTFYSPSFTDSISDEVTTGVLALQYEPSDELMLYASYNRGYKAGGINLLREGAITTTTYEPELADGFELGVKFQYPNGLGNINAALFHTEFSDLQINFFDGVDFRTENTGEATTEGLEVENRWQITEQLRWDFSATWLDSTFGDLGNPTLDYLSGRETPRAPGLSAVSNLLYDIPLASGRSLFTRLLLSYTGSHYVGSDVVTEQEVSSYTLMDFDLGFRGVENNWEVTAWCTNCTDETYRTIYFNSVFQPGTESSFLGAERQYGIRARVFF